MKGIFGPNNTLVQTPQSIQARTQHLLPAYQSLNRQLLKETAAASNGYATPLLGGASPPGLGFNFGASYARTQKGVMEFSLPVGQVASMDMALRYACENAFVGKALRLKTQLTCRGIKNSTASQKANDFFDQVQRELELQTIYRMAVWLYYTVGMAPILLPDPDEPFEWIQILDPRMVRTLTAYGKTYMYVIADKQMIDAYNDKEGRKSPLNKDYYDAMPKSWRRQLDEKAVNGVLPGGQHLIKLVDGSYLCLENRYNAIQQKPNGFDGIPLQPYFSACEQYRMGMAAQFSASFLAKNLVALVSVGDPDAEKEMYIRPDDSVLGGLRSIFQNPNQMQWIFGDPTLTVRYITPDKDAWASEQLAESKEVLKNLLPSFFWYNDGGGSFAAATIEMKPLIQECDAANDDFDRKFWIPIHERAANGRTIAKKHQKAPSHDRDALKDEILDLKSKMEAYNNGALDIYSLMEAHGFDPDTVVERLKQQQEESKSGIFMPAFEQKQNIVAAKIYGLNKPAPGASGDGGKGGRPTKPGSKPQAESTTGRQPRPGGKK